MIAWRQQGISTGGRRRRSPAGRGCPRRRRGRSAAPRATGTALDLRHAARAPRSSGPATTRSSGKVVHSSAVGLEFGDRRVRARASRSAAGGSTAARAASYSSSVGHMVVRPADEGSRRCAEVGEEDRVDELGLAARELGDEGDDQLVLVQAFQQLLDLEVDLGVGQVLLGQPFVQRSRCAADKAAPPVAVGFETGREFARLDHGVSLTGVVVRRDWVGESSTAVKHKLVPTGRPASRQDADAPGSRAAVRAAGASGRRPGSRGWRGLSAGRSGTRTSPGPLAQRPERRAADAARQPFPAVDVSSRAGSSPARRRLST